MCFFPLFFHNKKYYSHFSYFCEERGTDRYFTTIAWARGCFPTTLPVAAIDLKNSLHGGGDDQDRRPPISPLIADRQFSPNNLSAYFSENKN